VTDITLWDLHLLRWRSILSVLTFLVGRQFLVWSHTDLLIDLNWTMTNSEPSSKSSIRLRDYIAFLLEAWVNLKVELVSWLVCGRWWHSCCNVHIIDRLFQFFKVRSLWWLFGGGFAFHSSSNRLRVTFDNHWLERKDFLFVSSLIYVRWWWYNIAELSVSCLLRKLVCRNILAILHSCRPFLVWKIGILLFVRKSSMNLILLNNFLELFSIDALSLVVTKDHCLGNFLVLWILFLEELFNTVTIDVELFLITSFLVARDYWVKVKNVLIRGLQIWKQVVNIHTCWFVWAVLSLVGLTTWGQLELVNDRFSNLRRTNKNLLGIVLRLGMLWEVFGIFLLDKIVQIFDVSELTFRKKLHFMRPDDSNTHILSSIGHDGTS